MAKKTTEEMITPSHQTDSLTATNKAKKLFDRFADKEIIVYTTAEKTQNNQLLYSAQKKRIKVSELGTDVFPFLPNYVYYWVDVPVENKVLKKIDHRNPEEQVTTEKALKYIHEKDFVAIFADFFNEKNQVGAFAFTYETAAELFWLYQGITPEKFVDKFPRKFNVSDDYDKKIMVASQILAASSKKYIANKSVNIYTDFLHIEGVEYVGEYSQESLIKSMPKHIKAQL